MQQQQQKPRDVRRDVLCIGQLTITALVLYPVPYLCTQPPPNGAPQGGRSVLDEYVPVRLRYDVAAKQKVRGREEETIHIMVPQVRGARGELIGGQEFGVVEQRAATVLGPMMGRVLIRLEATVRRGATNAPILPLRILVFTPKGNLTAVANYLSQAHLLLDHPSVPYDPARHRDNPPYSNPHNPPPGGFRNQITMPGASSRWTQAAVTGKSVEVQRSQVDEVFKSLRSGEDLAETEPGLNIATSLYPHQKKALTFLLEREGERPAPSGKSISLWTVRKDQMGNIRSWYNVVTQKEVTKEPREAKGAILADDMGLGKTIAIVSLMAKTLDSARTFAYGPLPKAIAPAPPKPEPTTAASAPLTAAHFAGSVWGMPDAAPSVPEEPRTPNPTPTILNSLGKAKGKGKREEQRVVDEATRQARLKTKSRATLIVCPLSTIVNWEDQIREHWAGEVVVVGGSVPGPAPLPTGQASILDHFSKAAIGPSSAQTPAKIRLYVYHGAARRPDPAFLADFDAVITTFSTLATEFSKQTKSTAPVGVTEEEDDDTTSSDDGVTEIDGQWGEPVVKVKEKKKRKKPVVQPSGPEIPSPLQTIHWFRVVLDEAHSIKETSTVASRACCDLIADRRICLTGTPVQNKLDDVYALLKFIRLEPFVDKAVWTEFIGGPAKYGQPLGVARLQTIMKSITLRRTKETKASDGKNILNLPPRHDELRYLKFDEKEKAVYDSYYDESKAEYSQLRQNNEVMKNYVGILQKILRLRQICDHFELVQGKDEARPVDSAMSYDEAIAAIGKEGINLARATVVFALLRESGTTQCVECGVDLGTPGDNAMADGEVEVAAPKRGRKSKSRAATRQNSPAAMRPVLTRCQHLFCIECFRLSICPGWPKAPQNVQHACTVCACQLSPATDAVEVSPDGSTLPDPAAKPRPVKREKREKGSSVNGFCPSTKVKALLGDLIPFSRANPYSTNYDPESVDIQVTDSQGNQIDDGVVKTVVFSQWTSMLDKVEDALEAAGIRYDRLDGTMKREERTRAMEALKNDPACEVLLVSLRAGGVGLNLTAARRVYLMDPYWNPAVENQAVDRIHRLGQVHPVTTIKFVIEDSIETRLLEVQRRKTKLANLTLGQTLSKQEIMQRRMEELNELFAG
ncbi:hypothetical protein BOTBODRAFT_101668 [Botryobasidium botryosum FD-172 SS1]|uniref:Uncharacterized protein n=1 Tax=Botryobasidium botryosum (strain FD-172 SS1) TaxID=930990 RepID=A0A067N818_BOTB1|nr:hypothetical protein BOTBODRAFT_101668 [Botryobasidium botryosum FD-172 SS1]